jgi:hypothetical protein
MGGISTFFPKPEGLIRPFVQGWNLMVPRPGFVQAKRIQRPMAIEAGIVAKCARQPASDLRLPASILGMLKLVYFKNNLFETKNCFFEGKNHFSRSEKNISKRK